MESVKESSGLKNLFRKLQSQYNNQFKSQKTYIIPTKLGLSYGLLCLVLLLMAMAYGNNLVFIVCFTLTCMGMTLARSINTTIESVSIQGLQADNLYAEKSQFVQVTIENTKKQDLQEIKIFFKGHERIAVTINLKSRETVTVDVPIELSRRGNQKLPTLVVSSGYPSGLFNAWKVLKSTREVLVYPGRLGKKDFPFNSSQSENSIGLIREIRDYRPGDSPKRIHWRSLAKNKQLRTLIYDGEEGKKCDFYWKDLNSQNIEDKLSQFSLWLSLAETQNYDWTLELPRQTLRSLRDPKNFKEAMQVLSLWSDPG